MRFIITIIMMLCIINAKEVALYPVYSIKYDKVNDYILEE